MSIPPRDARARRRLLNFSPSFAGLYYFYAAAARLLSGARRQFRAASMSPRPARRHAKIWRAAIACPRAGVAAADDAQRAAKY